MEARRTRIKTSLIPIVGTGTSSSQSPGSAYFFTRAFKGVSCPHGSDGRNHEGRKEDYWRLVIFGTAPKIPATASAAPRPIAPARMGCIAAEVYRLDCIT